MRRIIAVMLLLAASSAYGGSWDIVIAGGGTGGTAAAIQASRMGARVLVVERTTMLGGQATAAGVSTMDDLSGQMSGLYRELMERAEEYYSARGKSMRTCYWYAENKAFEPHVGRMILAEMAKSADILYRSEVVAVSPDAVTILTPDGTITAGYKVLIDATEYGDVIPLAGAAYRAGNSSTPDINPRAMIQDITWTAIMRKYPDGVPLHLRPSSPLPGWEQARKNYTEYVAESGDTFRGTYPVEQPVDFATHNAYRGLPDSSNDGNFSSETGRWDLCTKTSVNWGNDYPGQYMWGDKYGLPVSYLESRDLRAKVERDALIKTLHFVCYVQNELHESWSVDADEYNELPEAAKNLPPEWQEIARHMPPIPYVRESRRIIGKRTITSAELYRNSLSYQRGNKGNNFSNAIAVGRYTLDLHHSFSDEDMDMGEREEHMISRTPVGNFQVPLDVLIPASVDGFLAAEKNISVSRLAAGALRLQPITMMTGQAAGVLAALSVKEGLQPRDVKALHVQRVLLDAGVPISLARYYDVPRGHRHYGAVQLSDVYGLLEPVSYPNGGRRGVFGVDEVISPEDITRLQAKTSAVLRADMTRGEALEAVIAAMQ